MILFLFVFVFVCFYFYLMIIKIRLGEYVMAMFHINSMVIDVVGLLVILGFALFFIGNQWWCYVPTMIKGGISSVSSSSSGSDIEGFVSKWEGSANKDLISRFLDYQSIANPNTQFNMAMLEEQVTPQEMEDYLKHGYWSWNDMTKKEYMYAIARNPMLNIYPEESLRSAQKVYNGAVMRYMIEWNKKAHPERWKLEKGRTMDDYINAPLGGTPQGMGISV